MSKDTAHDGTVTPNVKSVLDKLLDTQTVPASRPGPDQTVGVGPRRVDTLTLDAAVGRPLDGFEVA